MASSSISIMNSPLAPSTRNPRFISPSFLCMWPVFSSYHQNPYIIRKPIIIPNRKPHLRDPIVIITPDHATSRDNKKVMIEEKKGFPREGSRQMSVLCGFGYYVQGFRCVPWMALNFHMAHNLSVDPSILQVVQSSAILPMVAKPLYGMLSDAFYIGGAHRIPYISVGVVLQVISWGLLALIPVAGEALPAVMACVLLSNFGAAITEVAKDALTAEYGRTHKITGLQSYAFMALAGGGVLGNLLGGIFLLKTHSRTMFFVFTTILCIQLVISLATREDTLGLPQPSNPNFMKKSIFDEIRAQFFNLFSSIKPKTISRPLIWIVASISMVPILSGSIYCYQTQCLNLDPSIIGMSRMVSQLILLLTTLLYDRYWKVIHMRKLMSAVQILYATSLLLDFVLVTQMNLRLGISNKVFALCFSGIAETLAQFKLLPFSVLLAASSPSGCEGSLTSFFASAMCLSSMVSGFWGVGFANMIGITGGDYSRLPLGIMVQAAVALVPLIWISHLPLSHSFGEKERKKARSRRTRKTRRVGKVVIDFVYSYGRTREFDSSSI